MVKKIISIIVLLLIVACGKNNIIQGQAIQAVTNSQNICTDAAKNSTVLDISSNANYLCQNGTSEYIKICMAAAMRSRSYEIAQDAKYLCQQAQNINEATCMGGAIESGIRDRAENAKFYCQNVTNIELAKCMSKVLRQNDDFHVLDSREHENRRQSALYICQNGNYRNDNNRDHRDINRH